MYVSPYEPRQFTYEPHQSLQPTCGYMGAYVGSGFFLMTRFQVDIVSVTFLGPAPPAYTAQGKYLNSCASIQADFLHSVNPNSKAKAKGRDKL